MNNKLKRRLFSILIIFIALFVLTATPLSSVKTNADTPGADMNFTIASSTAPTVSTIAATSVSYDTVTLNGNLTSLAGALTVNVFFKYGTTIVYSSTTTVQAMTAGGEFSANITGLQPNTPYHFIAYAVDAANNTESGIGIGTDMTFTTLATLPPEVSTSPATLVNSTSATLNGFLDSRGTSDMVNVFFEYGLNTSYGSTTLSVPVTSAGAFAAGVTGLIPNVTYHFRAKADGGLNGAATPGADMTFTTTSPTAPTVSTNAATSVSYDTATLNGNLTSLGIAANVNVFFKYDTTVVYGRTTSVQIKNVRGVFSANITDLQPNTTYHFIAYAVDAANNTESGIGIGTDMTFTTLATLPPEVSTSPATLVNNTSATLNGFLDSRGTATTVNVFFEYGLNTSYGSTTLSVPVTSAGAFNVIVTGLISNTTYHFRAKADGESHGAATPGADMTFTTTSPTAPTVSTNAATSVSYDTATLNGNLTSLGIAANVVVFFKYDTTVVYGRTTSVQIKNVRGVFSANITDLQPNTTYHFIAYAVDAANNTESGIGIGTDMTFTTLATLPPEVSTSPATLVNSTSATLNGFLDSRGTATTVNVFFEYGLTTSYGSSTPSMPLTSAGAFSANITGLLPGTTVHFLARATGGALHGPAVPGADMTFTTETVPPEASTGAATGMNFTTVTLNGSLDSLGTASIVHVSFEYGATTAYGTTTNTQVITATGPFIINVSGLLPGTLYHFRAKANGELHGIGYGIDMTFTTLLVTPPGVTTAEATAIGYEIVTLNGNLATLGTATTADVAFEYGATDSYGTSTIAQTRGETGSFGFNISGLVPGTLYHFRAKANGELHGVGYGVDVTFSTLSATPPEVTSLVATNIGYETVTLNGNLASLGTATTADVAFEYGATDSYGSTTIAQARVETGAFSFNVSGLFPGTLYHFRAKAEGGIHGMNTGTDMIFTTLPAVIPIVDPVAYPISYDRATLSGNLNSVGTALQVSVSFEYATDAYYLANGNTYNRSTGARTMTSAGPFSSDVSGLTPDTLYHFRSKADAGVHGIGYSPDVTFNTLPVTPPAISTSAASEITSSSIKLNGNIISLGTAASVNVFFEYGTTASYGSITPTQAMTAPANFNFSVSGLSASTLYHFRSKANGGIHGTNVGADMTFTTLTPPTVNTIAATDITFNTATLNGNLNSLGTEATVNVFFEYGTTTDYGSTTAVQAFTAAGAGTFSASITGLPPGTLYHFRASADGGVHGTATGSDMTFTSLTPPTVSTNAATGITINTVTLNGNLASSGTANTVDVFFEYGTTTSYGNTTAAEAMTAFGTFNADVSGLSPGILYHFRAKVDGGVHGTDIGDDMTFTTAKIAPGVSSSPATDISANAVTLNGYLASLGTATSVKVSFEYGATSGYGRITAVQTMTSSGIFNANVSGLNPGATYHFRARADGGLQGTNTGDDMTFTTAPISPASSTTDATGITDSAVTLNGNLASLGTAPTANVSFEYGTTTSYGSTTPVQAKTGTGTFSFNVSGLIPGTLYHFRAKADGVLHGAGYGADMTFTTLTPPNVSTVAAKSIKVNSATLNGILTSLGTAGTVDVSFEYGLTAAYGSTTPVQALTATGTFDANLTGLTPGTAYHFRANANGGANGSSIGSDMTFTTANTGSTPPTVTTIAATSITTNSATVNGNLTSLGTAGTVNVSFEYGLTAAYGSTSPVQALTATGTFSANLTGLNPAAVYHFRVDADGGVNGSASASDMTFVTLTLPGLSTIAATSITTNSATVNGNLISLATAGTVNVFFEYGLTASYGSTTPVQALTITGTFSANLTGLTPATVYHFRANVDGGINGTASGSDLTFTTANPGTTPPTVSTMAATAITANSATIRGNLISLGTAIPINVSFKYGLTTAYGSTTNVQEQTATGTFSANLTGLTPATVYHFRAYADGGFNGTAAGTDMTVTTASTPSGGGGGGGGGGGLPPVSTIPAYVNGTESVDTSSIVSTDGVFNVPVTLQSQDGKVLLTITKGTIAHTGDGKIISSITVAQRNTTTLPPPPFGLNIVSMGYDFEPSGATFSPAVTMTLHYDPSSLQPGVTLLVDYFDNALQRWLNLPNFAVNTANNTITVQITHFTTFAILAQPAEVPVTTPVPLPTTTIPTIVQTPIPTPTPALIPALTPVLTPTPAPPQVLPTSVPERKAVSTSWIVAIAALVVILIGSAVYLFVRRKSRSNKAYEETVVQPENNNQNAALYTGTIKIKIGAPVFFSQMRVLEKCLRESPDLRLESVGGSSDEGTTITISINKLKPIYLIDVLKAMPPVEQVITKNNQIVIKLQPPATV